MAKIRRVAIGDRAWTDARGWVLNPLPLAGLEGRPLGNLHVASLQPGAVRGNHAHASAAEWLLFCGGPASLTTGTEEILVGGGEPELFEIPAGLPHAIVNRSAGDLLVVSMKRTERRPRRFSERARTPNFFLRLFPWRNPMLKKMKKLVKDKDVCVLATVMDNVPHCSLMSYVPDRDCREIYMMTRKGTKKFRNLAANRTVSLLIDTREEDCGADRARIKALTVSGVFKTIGDKAKKKLVRQKLLKKHPQLKPFAEDPDTEIFAVKVKTFQLLDGVKDSYFEKVK
jgi:nitroimidazol reductase NimA-like FMN-containing flavoprotein (pyridoxamine 5'-phosphate oxidase superfamily)/uncharacterized cupin superfamily protein